jgi:hypothetical protein
MMPIPVQPPPVQAARFISVPFTSPASTATVRREIRPLPPPPSRLEQRPVVADRWGHLSGLGNDTDRLQVQQPQGAMDLAMPIACGVVAYLIAGALTR